MLSNIRLIIPGRFQGGPVWGVAVVALAMVILLLARSVTAQEAPVAGTQIGNQAAATYVDETGAERQVTSNVVSTIVEQVGGVSIITDLSKTASINATVTFPHTITNTGNGNDSFTLSDSSQSGSFDFTSVQFFADENGDGIADDLGSPLTNTGNLAPGGIFNVVVLATVPSNAGAGDQNTLIVKVTSGFDNSKFDTVTDQTTVTANAVINATKNLSITSGDPGTDSATVTLTFTNTGNNSAADIRLSDLIPSGMTYVAETGRWSVTGPGTVLTDADSTDGQGSGTDTIRYVFDGTEKEVIALINRLSPGQSGTLRFKVNIDADAPPGTIDNTARYSFNDGSQPQGPFNTNTVPFTVNQLAAVSGTGDTVSTVDQGATIKFTNKINNDGNGTDRFNITIANSTFPNGTSFILFQRDGTTPLLDTNGDNIPDTGPIATGAIDSVVLQAKLPADATGGPFEVQKVVKSVFDSTQSVTLVDRLVTLASNIVDLTNDGAIGSGSEQGTGVGPEATAVVTTHTNPGTTTRFVLYINNTSGGVDSYDLAVKANAAFTQNLPTGWTVTFRDSIGAVITNTGIVPIDGNVKVFADVFVPSDQDALPEGQSLFFRAKSPTSGAQDIIYDAVVVNTVRNLTITPNNSGQVFPGGTVIYAHLLTNNGNVAENGDSSTITLSLENSKTGWVTQVYVDVNSDGLLDSGDRLVSSPDSLGSIAAGVSIPLLVKVIAPPGAALSEVNTTTLTATTSGTVDGITAPGATSATDNSTVISGNLVLIKKQAADVDTNGVADGPFVTTNISVAPGKAIRYQLTVTNMGTANVDTVVISDATPAFTTYFGSASTTVGTIQSEPVPGSTGTLKVHVGTLTPGQKAVIEFGVKINGSP